MAPYKEQYWKEAAQVFHEKASDYDQWFENSLAFDIELAALMALKTIPAQPRFEIGVGPGRFAEALCVKMGLDPALAPLALARKRGVAPCMATGEMLPIKSHSMGAFFLLFTLCFLHDPRQTLLECHRALKTGGHLVLGMIPATSSWGRLLAKKKEENHPFYRYAMFYDLKTVKTMLEQTGFHIIEARSTLFQRPDLLKEMEYSRNGMDERAGFVIIVAAKRQELDG